MNVKEKEKERDRIMPEITPRATATTVVWQNRDHRTMLLAINSTVIWQE
jgi:hypothetical protein